MYAFISVDHLLTALISINSSLVSLIKLFKGNLMLFFIVSITFIITSLCPFTFAFLFNFFLFNAIFKAPFILFLLTSISLNNRQSQTNT